MPKEQSDDRSPPIISDRQEMERIIQGKIAPKLRQFYSGLLEQPVPPRLIELLRRLEESEERRSGDGN